MTAQEFRAMLLGKRIVEVRVCYEDEGRPCREESGAFSRGSVTLVLEDGTEVSDVDTHNGSITEVIPPGRVS